MSPAPVLESSAPDTAVLAEIRDRYQRGFYVQAYELTLPYGPLRTWRGAEARVLAGRLAMNLGAPRLGAWLFFQARREDPQLPETAYYFATTLVQRRGPLAAWAFVQRVGGLPAAPPGLHADWLALHGSILAMLRDFDAAETWLRRAEEAAPEQPWVQVEWSHLLQAADRYEDALAASQRALTLHPWYRPAVQTAAHLLQLLDRDEEALALLRQADERLECGPIAAQRALLEYEMGLYADARRSYLRHGELSPLLEKELEQWLLARRADVACALAAWQEAAELAQQIADPFYQSLAERLTNDPACGTHVQLEVGFVRQHHQTCVPATLTALTHYWGEAAEHLEVAAAICYDGTPDHRERSWVEQRGWIAREFRVTWESAVALIDRGIPFTLTLVEPTSAHLQAVIGYDSRRRTLLIRDPTLPYTREFLVESMLERYAATGPRGMVLVPAAEAKRLDGLELPEAELYDLLYVLQRHLDGHRRADAAAQLALLEERAPNHRLTWHARRLLANYDTDVTAALTSVQGLLALYPEQPLYELLELGCLRELSRREERLSRLEAICARKEVEPSFWRELARELATDARQRPAARTALRRALRLYPLDTYSILQLGHLLWEERRFDEAFEHYRFASCLLDKDEGLAHTWFQAARYLRQTDAALQTLERRFARLGRQSSLPARTLYSAYAQCERMPAAFALLEKARELRPDDGELLLFIADAYSGHGELEKAAQALAAAEGRTSRGQNLRAQARLAAVRGEALASLSLWREVLTCEPLAMDAHSSVAQLLAETIGRAATLKHLRQAQERFPHHLGLHQLLITWLREEGPAVMEPVVRAMVANHPADAWCQRELALVLSGLGQHEEARTVMDLARALEPDSSACSSVEGQILERAGRMRAARAAYQEALRRSVDNDYALGRLLALADNQAERRAALEFVKEELIRQVTFGDAVLAYQRYASGVLSPEELLELLQRALTARPDLWHAWCAVVSQLTEMGQLDDALTQAREATTRFPLLPRLWIELAAVCARRQDEAGEIAALEEALRINPRWGVSLRRRAEVELRNERLDEARRILEKAVQAEPLDCINHGCLADVLWRLGEREPALQALQRALQLTPTYDWAWSSLRAWAAEAEQPDLPRTFARSLTETRGGETNSWMLLASTLERPEELEERLAVLDRVLQLNPWHGEAVDQKAELLANAGRIEDALAACTAGAWETQPPLFLRGRAAWIKAVAGDLPAAVESMNALLQEDPNYFWGCSKLVEWLRTLNRAPEYLQATEHLVRLSPDHPISYGYRAEARLLNDDQAGGRADLQHAFGLDPTYSFAGLRLFDLQLEDGDLDAAGQTLARMQEQQAADPYIRARAVNFACRRGDQYLARKEFEALLAAPGDDFWPLEHAVQGLRNHGAADVAEAFLRRALAQPELDERIASLWIRLETDAGHWDCLEQHASLLEQENHRNGLLYHYAHILGDHRNDLTLQPVLRRFLKRYRAALRATTRCWGVIGYTSTSLQDYAGTVAWMSDWEERQDAEPWMLINLTLAMRACGKDASAHRVHRQAMTREADHTTPHHRVWLALDDALAGQIESAEKWLADLDPALSDVTHRFVRAFAEILIAAEHIPLTERAAQFKELRARLASEATARPLQQEDRPAVERAYRQTARRLGRLVGTQPAWLWGQWRALFPRLGVQPSR